MPRDDRLLLRQRVNRVSELNFTIDPMGCLLQALKDFRAEDVATNNGEIRWRMCGVWLLDNAAKRNRSTLVARWQGGVGINNAVAMRLCWGDTHHADHRRLRCDIRLHKFGERWCRTEDEVVGEHHRKWFMANGVLRHEHGVAESELLFLTDRHKVDHVGHRSHGAKVLNITALLQNRLKVR